MASLQLHYVVEQEALKLPLLVKVTCDLKLLQTLRNHRLYHRSKIDLYERYKTVEKNT